MGACYLQRGLNDCDRPDSSSGPFWQILPHETWPAAPGVEEHILTMEERGICLLTIEERGLLSWKLKGHLQSKSFATSSLPLGDRASLRGKQKEGGQSTQELEIKRFESYFVLQGKRDTRLQKIL